MNGHAYPRYAQYKDSGSEWLGEIPEGWTGRRLKRSVSLVNKKCDDGNLPYVGLENVEPFTGRYRPASNESLTEVADAFSDQDVLLGKLRPYLAKAFAPDFMGRCTGEFLVLRPREFVHKRFLLYYCLSHGFVNVVNSSTFGAKMPRADWNFIGQMCMPLPSVSEQRAIAAFLDRETEKIDALIEKQERLIERLEEKRKALISHAVTHGLNQNVKMKDSGVQWLGKIPDHWKVVSIGHFSRMGNGSTPLRDQATYWNEGSYPWLNSSIVNSPVVGNPSGFVTNTALAECHLPRVPAGSVLVALTGEGKTRGMATVLGYEATINQHLAYITPRREAVSATFLRNALSAFYDLLRFQSEGTGSTKGALTCDTLKRFKVPLPPLSEQRIIVEDLEAQTNQIYGTIAKVEQLVEKLRERRTTLISAAVTGKIDMREVA
jgi:type I restriction enzyme S subunit